MAGDDFGRSLNEVVSGYQGMSQTLNNFAGGTVTPQGQATPMPAGYAPIPTPPAPIPVFIPPPPPPSPAFIPSPASQPGPAQQLASGYSMAGGSGTGMAMQRQQQMAATPQYMNPAFAGAMDSSFNMPSPGMFTDPAFGVFRSTPVGDPRAAAPYSVTGAPPPTPLLPMQSLLRTRPGYQFSRPFEGAAHMGSDEARLMQQGYGAYARGAGSAINTAIGGSIGTVGGALIGGAVGSLAPGGGTLAGAEWGSTIGGFAGSVAGMHPGLNYATSQLMRPAIEQRAEGIQAQAMSRRFVSTGSQLDISGRGLSTEGSMQLAGAARDIAKATEGQITQQDVLQLTQISGEQGLLDFAQNSEQIAKSMKSIMGLVSTMSEITGDPDFKQNVRRLGQMKRMGFETGQMDTAAQNLAQYARMAGVDVDQLMQRQGMQGAATFRGQGLLASQGMMTGAMAGGQARMFEASGAMGMQEVAMLGGQEGISQRINEMNAGFMSKMAPSMMGAMVKKGPGGELTIDKEAVAAIQSGKMTFQQALGKSGAVDQGTLTEMLARMPELQAEMGDAMGPQGIQMAMMQQAKQHSQLTGLNLRQSAQSIFGQEAGQVLGAMQDPKFQAAQLQQQRAERDQRVFEQQQAREAAADARPGFLGRAYTAGIQGLGMTTQEFGRYTSPLAQFQEATAGWFGRHEELGRRRKTGMLTLERDAPILKGGGWGTNIRTEAEERQHQELLGQVSDPSILAQERRGERVQGALNAPGETFFESEAAAAARQIEGRGGFFGKAGSMLNTGRAGAVNFLEVGKEGSRALGFGLEAGLFEDASRALGGGTEQMLAQERASIKATTATADMQVQASRLTDEGRQTGVASAQKQLGGIGETLKMKQKIRAMVDEHVGLGIGEEGFLSQEQLDALGPEFAALSKEDQAAMIGDVGGDKGAEFLEDTQKRGGRLVYERAEKAFKGKGSEAGLQAELRSAGLGQNVLGKIGGAGGAIMGAVSGAWLGSATGPVGMIAGAIAGGKGGGKRGGAILGAIGEEFGLDADLSDAEEEVAAVMTGEAAAFVVLAGMGPEGDTMMNALVALYKKEGQSDAAITKLVARGEEIFAELSPEAQAVIKTKGISLAGPDVEKAIAEGDIEQAAKDFEGNLKTLGAQVTDQKDRSNKADMGAFLETKGISGGAVSERALLKRIKSSEGAERAKFEKAFSKETVATVTGADLEDERTVTGLSATLGAQMGDAKGGEMTMAEGLMEGLTGGANIVGQMSLTKDMMAEFGEGQKIGNEHQAEMKGYLKIIAEHFEAKKAIDLVETEKE